MIKRYEVAYTDKYEDIDGNMVEAYDYDELLQERDRLLVLATKHCDKSHHDWDEILKIANDGEG